MTDNPMNQVKSFKSLLPEILFGVFIFTLGAVIAFNFNLGLAIFGATIGLLILFAALIRPRTAVFVALLISALSGAFVSQPISGIPISLSGVFTFFAIILGLTALISRPLSTATIKAIKLNFVFIVFAVYYGFRSLTGPTVVEGLRITLLIMTPVIIGVLASQEMFKRWKTRREVELGLMLIPIIPVSVLIINLIFNSLTTSAVGFKTTQLLSIGGRTLALLLLPILALYIARWRYTPGIVQKISYMIASLGLTSTVITSLSRTASVIMMAFIWPARFFKRFFSASTFAILILVASFFALWLSLPQVQARFFPTGIENFDLAKIKSIDTQGRTRLWTLTWNSAIEKPIFGHGGGFSKLLVREAYRLDHPHNEYLRVFADTGIVGVFLLLVAWGGRILHHFKKWRSAQKVHSRTAMYHFAALLTVGAVCLSFVTDNTLAYVFVTIPTFCIFSLADTSNDL
ncbi:MAG TPA: hypothetical protein DCP32_07070 [Anaerolineaceae bacterium]|nr:hypothetical protein [Anaerolineaceae bacterium]HBA90745.1 hypothetical protein [Anaerolineaceae bacterium]